MANQPLHFYSFFTQYSLMEEYGFISGIVRRGLRKILPLVPAEDTVEYLLLTHEDGVDRTLSRMDFATLAQGPVAEQLDLSIKALCSKVIAFGLDNNVKAKYSKLGLDATPFQDLLAKMNTLTDCPQEDTEALISTLGKIEWLITVLRTNKHEIGINFHLTLTTRRMLDYTHRTKELLELKLNIGSEAHWKKMFTAHVAYAADKDSIRRYLRRHSDLVALEIVEHTSDKGEKYIAENRKEYRSFFYRSLLGGGMIAVFALVKLLISSFKMGELSNAFFYSINYALCFIIVKEFGGLIATKQPAMTASTIARNIDKKDELQLDSLSSITPLVRKVFRSQFISIVGNFLMALITAGLIMFLIKYFEVAALKSVVKPAYLIKKVVPTGGLVAFAAIAGFYLALSGLISGYIDNKMVASKVGYRIRNNRLFGSKSLGYFVEKKAGALLGNISLGFLLGSTFLLSYVLPFAVDIRHIAFSSANVGYAVVYQPFPVSTIMWALTGALLIGLVNFIVSFSITLFLALKSRSVDLGLLPTILWRIIKDFFRHPLYYFFKQETVVSKIKE